MTTFQYRSTILQDSPAPGASTLSYEKLKQVASGNRRVSLSAGTGRTTSSTPVTEFMERAKTPMSMFKLLAIDDKPENLELISDMLRRDDLEILTAEDPEKGYEMFLRTRPKIVLLDLMMPKVSGMELMERMLNVDPGVDIVFVTADSSGESMVEAIQKGACDYLTRPINIAKLRERISSLLEYAEKRQKAVRLDAELLDACRFEGMVGRSPLMLEVFAKILRIAPYFRTVLVTGATGTGKELVASALHRLGPVANGPFVVCNCSALVDTLLESELFGHVRGAFTGANQDKAGFFEHAHGGTIFLDEIGELSGAAQAKLLRVLQNRQVQRVGALVSREIDVRVIAATHRDLKAMVRDGQFREDLYYRLAVAEVDLPTLANRREDLPLLQRYFIDKYSAEYKKTITGVVRRAQIRLSAYSWAGNVRELENVIANACMMTESSLIDIDDLPERLRAPIQEEASTDDRFLSLQELQRRHVLRVLEGVGGHKERAAEILGIGRATIYQLLSKMKAEEC